MAHGGGKTFNAYDEQHTMVDQMKSEDQSLTKTLNPRGHHDENNVQVQDQSLYNKFKVQMGEEKKRHGRVQLHLMEKLVHPQGDVKDDRASLIMTPNDNGLISGNNGNTFEILSPLKKPELEDTSANL